MPSFTITSSWPLAASPSASVSGISFWPFAASASASVSGTSFWWPLAITTDCLAVQMDQILLHMRISSRSRTTKLTRDPTTL